MADRAVFDANAAPEPPSKSERKRRMQALQRLGESLLALNDRQLAAIPLQDRRLVDALQEARRIRSNSARKRQLQYIGKLMRAIDPAPVEAALAALHESGRAAAAEFHDLEQLRDIVLATGPRGVELVLERFPEADRQQLRRLILQHEREQRHQRPPAASRKLFRYLRNLRDSR